MEKQERFKKAYDYLRYHLGIIHTQSDLAERMNASTSNISGAMKGNEKILTNKFLRRFNAAFENIFNLEWLLSGEGEMLSPKTPSQGIQQTNVAGNATATQMTIDATLLEEIQAHRRQVDRLITIIEGMQKDKGL